MILINALIVLAALPLLGGLLYFERLEQTRGKLLTKTPLSLLFVIAAFVQPRPDDWYFNLAAAALLLCLGGDVFLALKSERSFRLGLVSFLLGHVMYVAAFIYLTGFSGWLSWAALGVIGVSLGAFIWLRQHLGRMTAPVIAYIVVISIMVIGAWAVFTDPEIPRRGGFFVFAGALLFYLSDLFVARDRFVAPGFFNRRVGLPMYYAGQFLLAFSVGRIG